MSASQKKFKGVATTVIAEEGVVKGVYHGTIVCQLREEGKLLVLNSGGWLTNTTKARMNAFSRQYCDGKYSVRQVKGEWIVTVLGQCDRPFADGMIIKL